MGSEWQNTSIADISKSINTGLDAIRRAPIVDHPTNLRCLRIQDISQNKPIENWGYTETKPTDLEKYKLTKDEIIMARTCSTGICYLVEEDLPAVFNNGLARIRLDTERAYPKFIYHVFKSHQFAAYIDGISSGTSVQLNMKVGDMAKFELPLPPLAEQKAIAHILGTLDDKIELNRRMNATLEGMAQALFKSWFVDFDPVIDNALAAGNPIPDELAPRAEVRKNALASGTTQQGSVNHPTLSDPKALFPAAFEFDEELSWIPEGWEGQKLGDFALNITDGTHSTVKDNPEGECYLLSCKNIKNGQITIGSSERKINLETLNKLKKRTNLSKCDILLTTVGTVGETAMIRSDEIPYDFQRSVGIIKPNLEKNASEYLYQMVKSERFLHEALARSEGSVQRCLFLGAIKSIEVIVPEQRALEHFEKLVRVMYHRVETNVRTNESLTKLRDTLIPKLIAGELQVPISEQLSEEAIV